MPHFGIDFGTTNSAASKRIEGLSPQHYGDLAGRPYPSIVAIDKATDEIFSGREVWENRQEYIEGGQYHVIQSVKWFLGTNKTWQTERRRWTPEEVAAEVLKKLSERANAVGLDPITSAVIAIPVNYPAVARAALRRAAAIANIEVESFVTESTACIARHFQDLQHFRYIVVFDWGGGTLDVSVVESSNRRIQELATEGMNIAGDDIDLDIARAIHTRIMDQRGQSIPFELMSSIDRDHLIAKCELAKCNLSGLDATPVLLASYGGKPLQYALEKDLFESIISPHIELAIEVLDKAIQQSGLSYDLVDRIVVVGGSSNLRLLHDRLRSDPRFSAAIVPSGEGEWDVADGAAAIAATSGEYELAENIGIALSDNSFHELIRSGETDFQQQRELTLYLIEDAKQANIIIQRSSEQSIKAPQNILQFGVHSLGFDMEPILVAYEIDKDLVLRIDAHSRSVGGSLPVSREFGMLKFRYRI